jgi:hypothetical protein
MLRKLECLEDCSLAASFGGQRDNSNPTSTFAPYGTLLNPNSDEGTTTAICSGRAFDSLDVEECATAQIAG